MLRQAQQSCTGVSHGDPPRALAGLQLLMMILVETTTGWGVKHHQQGDL